MGNRETRWLLAEIENWQAEGVVSAETAATLRARYATEQSMGSTWGRIILTVFGVSLLGLGLIALLAANWESLTRPMRVVLAFLPLLISVGLYGIGVVKDWHSRAFLEPLGAFWGLSIGVGISLIAQTYQISGSPENFALTWSLLLLPVVWATQAVLPVIGYYVGLLVWVSLFKIADGFVCHYWFFALLGIPVIRDVVRATACGIRGQLMLWGAVGTALAALGITLEKQIPGLWIIIYTSIFSLLWLLGIRIEGNETRGVFHAPLRTLGGVGLFVMLYLLMFQWPWSFEYGFRALESYRSWVTWSYDLALSVAAPAAATAAWVMVWRGTQQEAWSWMQLLWGSAFIVVAGIYVLSWVCMSEAHGHWASVLVLAYLSLLGLGTLLTGIRCRALAQVKWGVYVLVLIVLGKFFSSEMSFTTKGVAFIACGTVLLLCSLYTRKGRVSP